MGVRLIGTAASAALLLACSSKSEPGNVGAKGQNLGRSEADWVEKGPQVITNTWQQSLTPAYGYPGTGAIERFILDPANPTGAYAAAVSGGIWKTPDFTTYVNPPHVAQWLPMTDELPSIAMGDLAIDPQNPSHLVAGTGCMSSAGFCVHEGLVYESFDGGDSWSIINELNLFGQKIQGVEVDGTEILVVTGVPNGTDLDHNGVPYAPNGHVFRRNASGGFDDLVGTAGLPANLGPVYDLVPDPTAAGAYYIVAGSSNGTGGVYRGLNHGQSWTRVSNSDTGTGNLNFALNARGDNARLATGPLGSLVVSVAANGHLVRVARTVDQGQSWTRFDEVAHTDYADPPGTAPTASGPVGFTSISRVAGSAEIVLTHTTDFLYYPPPPNPSDPPPPPDPTVHGNEHVTLIGVPLFGGDDINGVWRIQKKSDNQVVLVNRYDGTLGNGGTTAASVTTGQWAIWHDPNYGGQTWIHMALAVDPFDETVVYIGGDASANFVARGKVGAPTGQWPSAQWATMNRLPSGTFPHADVRDLLVTEVNGSKVLIAATDGGLFLNDAPDTPTSSTWLAVVGGLATAEMYTIAIDPVTNGFLAGLQDNGTPASDDIFNGSIAQPWQQLAGADGQGATAVNANQTDPATGLPVSYRYTNWQLEGITLHARNSNGQPALINLDGVVATPPALEESRFDIPLLVPGSTSVFDLDNLEWTKNLTTNPFEPERFLVGGRAVGVWESKDHGLTAELIQGSPINATSIDAGAPGNHEALWIAAPTGLYSRQSAGSVTQVAGFPPGEVPVAVAMVPSNPQSAYVTTHRRVSTNPDIFVWSVFTNAITVAPDPPGSWVPVTGDLSHFRRRHAGKVISEAPAELLDIEYVESAASDRVIISAAKQYVGAYMMAVDDPGTWMRINTYVSGPEALPYVPVNSLDYNPLTDILAVGTAGRGAWVVEDVSGLNRAPIPVCKDHPVDANASCEAYVSGTDFANGSVDPDAPGVPVFYYVYTYPDLINGSSGPYGLGEHDITIQVNDNQGAAALCDVVKLIVTDNTPPTLEIPADVELTTCTGATSVTVGTPTAMDNCSQNLQVTGHVISKNGVALSPPIEVIGGVVTLGPGNFEIEWVATDGSTTPFTDIQHVSVGTAIQAGQTYLVAQGGQVRDTSNNAASVFNSGTGMTTIRGVQDDVAARVGSIHAGGSVEVNHGGQVIGNIYAVGSTSQVDMGGVTGSIIPISGTGLPALPALPTYPTPNMTDFTVNPNEDKTIQPGNYRDVAVNGNLSQHAILRFVAGDYYVTNLYMNSAGITVLAEPGTRIFVRTNINFHNPFRVAPNSNELAPVYLGIAGTGGVGVYAPFTGTIVAPGRNLSFGTGSGLTFTGSFFANGIEVTPNSVLVCDASTVTPEYCSDETTNFDETDVDCGGPICSPCDDGLDCEFDEDCLSGMCPLGVCLAPTCEDGVTNGDETDTDCGGPACDPCPVACTPATYQAENMFHSTGNAWWQGGWNIYSNGYISQTHTFAPGLSTIRVRAMGQAAGGLPHMEVLVDGTFAVPTAGVNVASGAFNDYTFTFNSPGGSQTVRVEYDNDYNGPLGDRNLIVDWVEVGCP